MKHTTSIIDVPKGAKNPDLLGIDKYKSALIRFIQGTDTPITIAIQGEWGSGKTSLMNSLKKDLCGDELDDLEMIKNPENEFYPVWVNTWQYSLMKSTSSTLTSVIGGITEDIVDIIESKHSGTIEKGKAVGKRILSVLMNTGAKAALSTVGLDGDALVDSATDSREKGMTILKLRNELQDAINDCLESDAKKGDKHRGFIFFIDDLDRIDPPVAVQILELLKNIFDLNNCIFILAIDYDVVIKGLKPKFGELTEKNEREFRSFFDKIIQLPFTMPIASYQIDSFLIDSLRRIEFINEKQEHDLEFIGHLTKIANLTLGTNPRALKRLCNTLSLINIINLENEDANNQEDFEVVMNYAFVCLQIAYPYIYNQLTKEPNFLEWNQETAHRLKLKPLSEDELAILDNTDEFDEDWEKVLYRMCQKETFLSSRVFQISTLLNDVKGLIPEGKELEESVRAIMELSSVTNLEAFDKQPVKDDLNLNNLLKSCRTKFYPHFKNSKPANVAKFQQEGSRIVKNLATRFYMEDGLNDIFAFSPRVKNGKIIFWIGNWGATLTKTDSKDFDKSLTEAGTYEQFLTLEQSLDQFQKNTEEIELFEMHRQVITWRGTKYAKFQFWFGITFNHDSEILTDEGLQRIGVITNMFIQKYADFKKLQISS